MDPFEYVYRNSDWDASEVRPEPADDGPQYTPEGRRARKLWLTVLSRAVEEGYHDRNLLVGKDGDIEGLRREAREWLGTDSADLREVCQLANVEVSEVLRMYGRTE